MMKYILTCAFLLYMSTLLSQKNDSICIQTRWIELDSSAANHSLFTSDNDKNNIVDIIKDLTLNGPLDIYREEIKDIYYESNWVIIDSIELVPSNDTVLARRKADLFDRAYTSWDYLKDENGDPVWEVQPDGTEGITFMPPIDHPLKMSIIRNILVREHLIFNEESSQEEFVATGVALVIRNGDHSEKEVVFWVSIFELNDIYSRQRPDWLNALNERNYVGFQYMQKPCKSSD